MHIANAATQPMLCSVPGSHFWPGAVRHDEHVRPGLLVRFQTRQKWESLCLRRHGRVWGIPDRDDAYPVELSDGLDEELMDTPFRFKHHTLGRAIPLASGMFDALTDLNGLQQNISPLPKRDKRISRFVPFKAEMKAKSKAELTVPSDIASLGSGTSR